MMYCSVLWILLIFEFFVFSVCGISVPSNQLGDLSRIFLRFTENRTNKEHVVIWNSKSRDGSLFSTQDGTTNAVFYSLNANEKYVMKNWPNGICTAGAIPRKADSPIEGILSSGKKFNIIQLLTGEPLFIVKKCFLKIRRKRCISSYQCTFDNPERGNATVLVDTCTQLVWQITVPLVVSGKSRSVKYTIFDNIANWTDAQWLSAPTSVEKINLIDLYSSTPSGVYCTGRNAYKYKTIPKLPKYFSMYVDEVHAYEPKLRKVSFKVFDYKNRLVREDFVPDPKHNPKLYRLFGNSMLQIVEDFNTGSRFVMDARHENCTIIPLGFGLFTIPMRDSHVRMKYSYELFNSDNRCWRYSGTVHVRGFPTDRFICQRKVGSYPDVRTASVETQELYYRNDTDGKPVLVLMRHINEPINKKLTTEFADYTWHIIDYRTDQTDHTLDVFDVTRCYGPGPDNRRELIALIHSRGMKIVKEPHLYIKVRNKLAEVSGVPPHRITKLHFSFMHGGHLVMLSFTLLGLPSAPQQNDHYRIQDRVSITNAQALLTHNINKNLVVIPGEYDKYRIYPHSLRTVQDLQRSPEPDSSKKYTSGDMAALGLSTIGIGAIGSAMALLCFQRRRRQAAVAYYVKT